VSLRYQTAVTVEYFLQYVTENNRIAGFLRLSLPGSRSLDAWQKASGNNLPVFPGEAMIREIHVYGQVAQIGKTSESVQHFGLGKTLIESAARLAKSEGYSQINVISAVGTRQYYRNLGFADSDLYQQTDLDDLLARLKRE
jgi:elongator complex protein 3